MTLGALGIGYLATGGVAAIVVVCAGRLGSAIDALWLVTLWPLWLPLSLAKRGELDDHELDDHELIGALDRARSSPLAGVLPDADNARVLATRLREATARLAELDTLLARPDFDPGAVERHACELAARGAVAAASTARLRVRTLGQLRALRERYRTELDDVHELIAQLITQAELVRLQPSVGVASGELVRELVDRVEGLGELFAFQSSLEYESPVSR
ncbi:MAG: hypothetical protein WKG01_12605 [Kofleriaceae bacterium]